MEGWRVWRLAFGGLRFDLWDGWMDGRDGMGNRVMMRLVGS